MAKQVMDIADGRDSTSKGVFTSALSDEHQRNWNDEQWQRKMNEGGCNYDRTREKLNFEVTKGGAIRSIDTRVRDKFCSKECDLV